MADETHTFNILRLSPTGSAFRREHLDPLHLAHLPSAGDPKGNPIFVMQMDDLESLLRSVPKDHIIDRKTRHDRKPLGSYLAGKHGMFAMRAHYTKPGQAARSLRNFRDAAAGHRAAAVYFIGVPAAIYEALEARSEAPEHSGGRLDEGTEHLRSLVGDSIEVPEELRKKYLGEAAQVEWVRRCIVLASRIKYPVLIQGESGTGKEVVAREIHKLSARENDPFIPVNCGGIPEELFESELFGHVRGAFTGATRSKSGFWTLASTGTLFLDEIGDLARRHQVKLLRALEDGKYYPVGAEEQVRSNARIIAATNRDLVSMVQSGQFREDLYFRLFNFRIRTPALREHRGDIPILARHFWEIVGEGTPPLTGTVTDTLMRYGWPGNARELRSFLTNLRLVAGGRKVDTRLVNAVMRERLGPALSRGKDA